MAIMFKIYEDGSISGGSGTFDGTVQATTISATTYLNLPTDADGSNWSSYPATATISAAGQTLSAGTISATTYQNIPVQIGTPSAWASYAAVANLDMSGRAITGVSALSAGTITGGTIIGTTISATTYQNIPVQIGTPSAWATYAAVANLNMSGRAISGVSALSATTITGGTIKATTISATTYQNLPAADASTWSTFVATQDISAAGNSLLSGVDVEISGTVSAASANFSSGYIGMGNGWSLEFNEGTNSMDFVFV